MSAFQWRQFVGAPSKRSPWDLPIGPWMVLSRGNVLARPLHERAPAMRKVTSSRLSMAGGPSPTLGGPPSGQACASSRCRRRNRGREPGRRSPFGDKVQHGPVDGVVAGPRVPQSQHRHLRRRPGPVPGVRTRTLRGRGKRRPGVLLQPPARGAACDPGASVRAVHLLR
jgi:hypothetical protein